MREPFLDEPGEFSRLGAGVVGLDPCNWEGRDTPKSWQALVSNVEYITKTWRVIQQHTVTYSLGLCPQWESHFIRPWAAPGSRCLRDQNLSSLIT